MSDTILVVDDDARLLHVLAVFFELKGYEVRTAAGGLPALEAIGEQRPDVVILDALMPDLGGLEVCKRLRSDEKLKGLPIIIVTAAAELEKPAIAAGADAFVSKPFDLDELLGRVEENRARG